MKNNKIIILIFSLMSCGSVLSMEEDSGEFNPLEMGHQKGLVRQKGFWTDRQDLLPTADPKILYMPTKDEHQREDWYQWTKYVAEPWCTVTNLPFLYVAHKFMDKKPIASAALAFAGSMSTISHAVPKHGLNVVDRLGAFAAVAGVVYDCNLHDPKTVLNVVKNPAIMAPGIAMAFVKWADRELAHNQDLLPERKKYQTLIHCIWHLVAAYTAFIFLVYATR